MIIGYTTGVFDMFHVGHLNILKNARQHCDRLIVGVSTDELVNVEKKVSLVIPFKDRIDIVRSIRWVDQAVPQNTYDKMEAWNVYRFNKMFVGDDWQGSQRWLNLESRFKQIGVQIVYIPYTQGVSSSILRKNLIGQKND